MPEALMASTCHARLRRVPLLAACWQRHRNPDPLHAMAEWGRLGTLLGPGSVGHQLDTGRRFDPATPASLWRGGKGVVVTGNQIGRYRRRALICTFYGYFSTIPKSVCNTIRSGLSL